MSSTFKDISELLAGIGAPGSFATRRTAPAGDLKLEVRGVGRVRFPITATTARKLCAIARPARHGFKDQTRLDTRVRDTWQIPRSRISIDQPSWQKTLVPQLERIRGDLGLPQGSRLKAELHNLLVYAPGQFFVTRRYSEKADHMIGALVVSLPSRFTGGTMVIEYHDEKLRVGGSDSRLTLTAFYADCHHEVRPIERGYRVVLTYNLILESAATAATAPADRVAALTRRVREFFDTPPAPRWKGDREPNPPDRLVYLLDHQYTQRGIAWSRLKNADAERAAALKEVARELDCEIVLALADVHETWACEEEYSDYRSRWNWRYEEEEDEDESENASDPEMTELLDSDVELRHWVGPDGRPKAMAAGVGAHELCYTKPSVELEPFESEHEGYMGNYGNTIDRWYHRAAVVLWPRERTFVIRAKASPLWAVGEITKTLKQGNAAAASTLARRVLPFWAQAAGPQNKPGLVDRTLQVAAKLEDPEVAAALLDPFTLTSVTSKAAPRLVELLDRYELQWCRALMRRWMSKKHYEAPQARLTWMSLALPALCRPLCARGGAYRQAFEWPLAKEQRAHVHGIIDSRDLPVRHTTRRTGRPFTLVLEKTPAVFERDAAERRLRQQEFDWLTRTTGSF